MRFARFARRRPGPATPQERRVALVLTIMFCALTSVFFPTTALAAPQTPGVPAGPPVPAAPKAGCSFDDLQDPARRKKCLADLGPVPTAREQCIKAPTPTTPDSGMAGWFTEPPKPTKGYRGAYLKYGYAGYNHTTYDDPDCGQTTMYPEFAPEHKIANAELLMASGIIGASNALRERAWDPGPMWDWANPLVEKATTGIYQKVFTVFGAITLAIVGIYLIWRSRQADMNDSLTTASWAVLVIVVVTAVVAWPVFSANLADGMLLQSLGAIHSAIGPEDKSIPPDQCALRDKEACKDNRKPAVRASDTATEAILYQNWLRGALGTSESDTARKYGPALYHAKAFTWDELRAIRPEAGDSTKERQKKLATRNKIIEEKAELWKRTAEQIRKTDPEAYEHLQGQRGMERIGASFIALLAAVFFSLFDIVTSVLILLGFLVFRWAVVAAPLIGTFAMLRPASTGLKRLGNAVVAAIFNIVIFGAGAAVYLFAVDLILSTASLAGWLQVLLIGLCGIAGWMLLRPYRRLTQLGGAGGSGGGGGFSDRLLARSRTKEDPEAEPAPGQDYRARPETRAGTILTGSSQDETPETPPKEVGPLPSREPAAAPSAVGTRPDSGAEPVADTSRDEPIGYQLYVPDSRRRAMAEAEYGSNDSSAEHHQPLFVPDEWEHTHRA